MSSEILMDYFTARGDPGWHMLGTVFSRQEQVTLMEAGGRTGMNFRSELHPVFVQVDDLLLPMPSHMAIVRPPLKGESQPVPMEVVGKNYQLVSNDHLFEMFDELSKIFPVETIGVLGNGERVFIALDAGFVDVKGDPLHQYLTIYDEKTGRSATKIILTPVRVVCANTLRMSIAEATLTVNVAHVRGNLRKLEATAQLAMDLQHRMDATHELFGHMAVTPFSKDDFAKAVAMLYQLPPKPEDAKVINVNTDYDKLAQNQLAHRDKALELFEKFNDEQPDLASTQWGAYQAIVELEDWKKGRGTGRYSSALFGERAEKKMDAFSLIMGFKID